MSVVIEKEGEQKNNIQYKDIDLLDQAFYQPEKNAKEEEQTQAPWSIIASQEKLETLEKEHKTLIAEFGNDESRGSVFALGAFGLVVLSSLYFALTTTWQYNAGSAISDKIMFCFIFGFMGLAGGFFAGAGIGFAVQKIYFQIWKRGREATDLLMRRARKSDEILKLKAEISSHSSEKMNEAYYFESLLKFDHMVERIHKAYPEDFLQSDFLKEQLDFQAKRDRITHNYLQDYTQDFCKCIEETHDYESRIKSIWEKYQKTDKNMLEQRYQEFAKNKTPEMLNVL